MTRLRIVASLLRTCVGATLVIWVASWCFAWRALRGRTLSARRLDNQLIDFAWEIIDD